MNRKSELKKHLDSLSLMYLLYALVFFYASKIDNGSLWKWAALFCLVWAGVVWVYNRFEE